MAADETELEVEAKPTEDPSTVDHVVEAFGNKYGADRVTEYYPGVDAAVEVPLA